MRWNATSVRRRSLQVDASDHELVVDAVVGEPLKPLVVPQFSLQGSNPRWLGRDVQRTHAPFALLVEPAFERFSRFDEGGDAIARVEILTFPVHLEGHERRIGGDALAIVHGDAFALTP